MISKKIVLGVNICLTCLTLQAEEKKVVLWAIEGVLLLPDISAVSGGNIGSFLGFTPDAVKRELFRTLHRISFPEQSQMSRKPGTYPSLIKYWLLTKNSSQKVRKLAIDYIKKNYWLVKKKRLKTAAEIAFTPRETARTLKSNQAVARLAHQCKNKNSVCIASNWNREGFEAIKYQHPGLFAPFEHLYISGNCNILASEKSFFDAILDKLGVEAKNCYFIDCDIDTLKAAQQAGITTITYRNYRQIKHALEEHNLL